MIQQGRISAEDGQFAGAEQAVGIEIRPERGTGYSYAWFKSIDFAIPQSGVDITTQPQVDLEVASTFYCLSWQGSGIWRRRIIMSQDINGQLHITNMEESGSVINNLVTVELRRDQVDADGQSWVIVYREGEINTYTIVDGQTYNWPIVWHGDSLTDAENLIPYTFDLRYF